MGESAILHHRVALIKSPFSDKKRNEEIVMSIFWSQRVRNSQPYVAGEQPRDKKYIKLNTNENPYPPSAKALAAIRQATDGDLKLYPDPEGTVLKEALAAYYRLEPGNIFIGNGSDEVLAFSFMAFFNPGDKVFFPDITYSFYVVYANIFGVDCQQVPLDDEYTVDLEKMKGLPGGIILANPNAPTGRGLTVSGIKEVLRANPQRIVIVDEAYVDFGGETAAALVVDHDNLLVVQTFSKSRSLAGLRVGFALGHPALVQALDRIKNSINSYTLDRLALAGSVAALADEEYFRECCRKVVSTRERVAAQLQDLGFVVLPSRTNFLFIAHPSIAGQMLFQALKERGILVRHFARPRIENFLRVTIGSDEDMVAFMRQLEIVVTDMA